MKEKKNGKDMVKKKKANSSRALEMSCGSRQISAATVVISAPRVGYIDEELHNAVHPRKASEMGEVKEEREGA